MASPWLPPPFDPTGECTCTPRHSPRLMVVEDHHVLPLSWGGPNTPANKARVCPNTHYGTHALLNEYVRHKGTPPPTVVTLYTKPAQFLAALAWKLRDPSAPTPYWLPTAAPIQVEPSWYSAHALPRSTRSFATVFFATPVIRTVARIELPSMRQRTTCALRSVESLFILTIMLEGYPCRQDPLIILWRQVAMCSEAEARQILVGERASALVGIETTLGASVVHYWAQWQVVVAAMRGKLPSLYENFQNLEAKLQARRRRHPQ